MEPRPKRVYRYTPNRISTTICSSPSDSDDYVLHLLLYLLYLHSCLHLLMHPPHLRFPGESKVCCTYIRTYSYTSSPCTYVSNDLRNAASTDVSTDVTTYVPTTPTAVPTARTYRLHYVLWVQ